MKKGNSLKQEKWCKKLLAKTGYVSAQKSNANYFTYTAGSNMNPVCVSTEVVKYRIG
jgi:hypothetical protein